MKRSLRQKYACSLNVFSENYELLYNVKPHVDMVKRNSHRVSLVNISYTQSKEKKAGKNNGSSDLVDLGTFRLIRRSSEKSTWPGIPWLVLQGNRKVLFITGHVKLLHCNLE